MIVSILMTLIGFGIINGFLKDESILEKMALGFLLGFGLVIVPLFFLTYFHIRLNASMVWITLLSLLGLSFFLYTLFRQKKTGTFSLRGVMPWFKKLSVPQQVLLFLIIALFAASLIINLYWPVSTWDSITLYDFRARLYAQGGLLTDLWEHVGRNSQALSYYYSYPPSTSLTHTVGYFIHDSQVMVVYSFFYIALILIFLGNIVRKASLTAGFFLTFLLASNTTLFYHSTIAYTNLPYSVYLIALFFMLERYIQTQRKEYFIIAIVFSLFGIVVRSMEPFYLVIASLLLIETFKNRRYIWDFIILLASSYAFKKIVMAHFGRDLFFVSKQLVKSSNLSVTKIINSLFDINKLSEILIYVYHAMVNYHLYILLFVICSIIFAKSFKKNFSTGAVIILSILILLPGTFILSLSYDGWNKIPDSANRLMIFLYPLILYFLGSFPQVEKLLETILNFYPRKIANKLKKI